MGEIRSGWFVISPDGQRLALRNAADEILVLSDAGEVIDHFSLNGESNVPVTVLDMQFSGQGTLGMLYALGDAYALSRYGAAGLEPMSVTLPQDVGIPTRLWFDQQDAIWLEGLLNNGGRYVTQLGTGDLRESAPETDTAAVMRIGRITAPYAVTSDEAGDFALWNLERGELLTEVSGGGIPDIGYLEPSGRYLAWRDPLAGTLSRMDFGAGENRIIGALEAYAQAIFISTDGAVTLAVDVDFEPLILAWITGEETPIEVGRFRLCERTPDAIHLSEDGTTLAIGCGGEGIELWRVKESEA